MLQILILDRKKLLKLAEARFKDVLILLHINESILNIDESLIGQELVKSGYIIDSNDRRKFFIETHRVRVKQVKCFEYLIKQIGILLEDNHSIESSLLKYSIEFLQENIKLAFRELSQFALSYLQSHRVKNRVEVHFMAQTSMREANLKHLPQSSLDCGFQDFLSFALFIFFQHHLLQDRFKLRKRLRKNKFLLIKGINVRENLTKRLNCLNLLYYLTLFLLFCDELLLLNPVDVTISLGLRKFLVDVV